MNDGLFSEHGYRKYIFLFFIFIIFLLFIIIYFANRETDYLIVGESFVVYKRGSKLKQLDYISDNMLDNKFNVYSDGVIYKNITIKNDSMVWYYFDNDYKDLELTNVSVAYSKGFKGLKVADYNVSYYEEEDDDVLKDVLGDNIQEYEDSLIKSSFDLDGDGEIETIYTINNFNLASSDGDSSFIFLKKNGDKFKLIEKSSTDAFLVQNIIDLDNDGKYEIFYSKGTNDEATLDTCINIYSFSKKKFLFNCE